MLNTCIYCHFFYYFCGMKKCLTIILMSFVYVASYAQHEGIERHFDEYFFGDFLTRGNYYSSDTTTDCFHLFRNTEMHVYSTGNLGSANVPVFYYKQYTNHEFVFFTPYTPFISTLKGSTYFDTRTPFTRIVFIGGEKQLDNIYLVHTQNIKPWLNFGAEYKTLNTEGHYAMQQAKNQSLNLFVSVTKHRYNNHLNFIHNKISHENNGGIESDEIFEAQSQRSENLGVNLFNSTTKLAQTGISYYHELLLGEKLTDTVINNKDTSINVSFNSRFILSQSISYNRYHRVYKDIPDSFYENIYLDSTATYDSVGLRKFSHSFDVKFFIKGNAGELPQSIALAGLVTDLLWYSTDDFVTNNSLYARWFSNAKLIEWDVVGKYFISGYSAGDFHSEINFILHPEENPNHIFSANAEYSITKPDFFYSHYISNHFIWNSDLPKTKHGKVSVSYDYLKWQIHTSVQYNFLDAYLYFDGQANPTVSDSNCNILSAEIGKKFNLGKFHWYNQVQVQYLSNQSILSLPLLGAYSSLYFQSPLFKKVLTLQIGVDGSYFSKANGFAYMPATGVFYRNSEKEFGNFFIFDAYVSIKVKRFRAFVKVSHFNDLFMPADYYGLLHYPADPMSINFGISWEFYN